MEESKRGFTSVESRQESLLGRTESRQLAAGVLTLQDRLAPHGCSAAAALRAAFPRPRRTRCAVPPGTPPPPPAPLPAAPRPLRAAPSTPLPLSSSSPLPVPLPSPPPLSPLLSPLPSPSPPLPPPLAARWRARRCDRRPRGGGAPGAPQPLVRRSEKL